MSFVLVLALFLWVQTRRITVTHYTHKAPAACKLLILADLHNAGFGKNNRRLLKKIHALQPDAILIPGDMNRKKRQRFDRAEALLEALAPAYPVFYAPGNHEAYDRGTPAWCRYMEKVEHLGVHYLENESVLFQNMHICGLSLEDYYRNEISAEELEGCLGKKQGFTLLLAHSPLLFDGYADWGADLVLAGHLHGFRLRLPFLGGTMKTGHGLLFDYAHGAFQKKNTTMYVSRGLGVHSIPVRIFNPPELVMLHLEN